MSCVIVSVGVAQGRVSPGRVRVTGALDASYTLSPAPVFTASTSFMAPTSVTPTTFSETFERPSNVLPSIPHLYMVGSIAIPALATPTPPDLSIPIIPDPPEPEDITVDYPHGSIDVTFDGVTLNLPNLTLSSLEYSVELPELMAPTPGELSEGSTPLDILLSRIEWAALTIPEDLIESLISTAPQHPYQFLFPFTFTRSAYHFQSILETINQEYTNLRESIRPDYSRSRARILDILGIRARVESLKVQDQARANEIAIRFYTSYIQALADYQKAYNRAARLILQGYEGALREINSLNRDLGGIISRLARLSEDAARLDVANARRVSSLVRRTNQINRLIFNLYRKAADLAAGMASLCVLGAEKMVLEARFSNLLMEAETISTRYEIMGLIRERLEAELDLLFDEMYLIEDLLTIESQVADIRYNTINELFNHLPQELDVLNSLAAALASEKNARDLTAYMDTTYDYLRVVEQAIREQTRLTQAIYRYMGDAAYYVADVKATAKELSARGTSHVETRAASLNASLTEAHKYTLGLLNGQILLSMANITSRIIESFASGV